MLFSHQKLGKLEKQNIANKRLSSCRGVVLDIAFRTVYARYVSTIECVLPKFVPHTVPELVHMWKDG